MSDDSDSEDFEDKASDETQPNSDQHQEPSPEILIKLDEYKSIPSCAGLKNPNLNLNKLEDLKL